MHPAAPNFVILLSDDDSFNVQSFITITNQLTKQQKSKVEI